MLVDPMVAYLAVTTVDSSAAQMVAPTAAYLAGYLAVLMAA